MKKITVLLLIASVFATACKDNTKDEGKEETLSFEENLAQHYLNVYNDAKQINDIISVTTALNSYLSTINDSMRSVSPYMDTLILYYQEMGQYPPLYSLSDEKLRSNPNDTDMLVLNVGVAQVVGQLGAVADRCLRLVKMFPNDPTYKFSYSASLLENRKLKEGEDVLLEIANDPSSASVEVPFTTVGANGQPQQTVTNARVGAYMKLGQMFELLKDYDKAMKYYRNALNVDSDYRPASAAILQLKSKR